MAKKMISSSKYPGTLTLEVLEGAHRYNAWIAEAILPHILAPVLEVGSGIGNISSFFLEKSPLIISDNDKVFVDYLIEKFKKDDLEVVHFDISKSPPKRLEKAFNTTIAVNVLEHLEDDLKALKNIKKTLKKNGKIVLLVPAKKVAYNKLDRELGHFRRYEKKETIMKLESLGFKIEKVTFFNILGLITWITRDFLTQKDVHLNSRQVAFFDSIVPVLKRIEKIIPVPVGISLIVVARNEKE